MSSYVPISSVVNAFHTPYNNVYQGSSNLKMSKVPVIQNTSIRNELSSNRFNSVTDVNLPQNVLLENSFLVLAIRGSDLKVGTFLERGWGYSAIRKIRFQVSGSGQSLEMTGQALLMKNLADAETSSKAARLMKLAGEPYDGVAAPDQEYYYAYINLYLPWGSVSSKRFCPYDGSILRSPATITIEIDNAVNFMSRSIGLDPISVYPTQFSEAFVLTRTQIMREPSPMPAMFGPGTNGRYCYAYQYPQHQQIKNVTGVSDDAVRQSVQLKGFRSGNLQSIDMWLQRETFDADAPMNDSPHSRLLAYAPRNIRVLYGGQELYRSELDTAQIFNLCTNTIDLVWDATSTSYVVGDAENEGNKAAVSQYVHIDLAQYNETVFTDLLQVGIDAISQDFQIEFNTPRPANLVPSDPGLAEPKWTVHFNYNYLASVTTTGGDTQLEFVSPKMIMSAGSVSNANLLTY